MTGPRRLPDDARRALGWLDDEPAEAEPWVLVCHGLATEGAVTPPELIGQFLETYDVEAHDGRGDATWTTDPAKAVRFEDLASAVRAWQSQSRTRPLREDGRPNRPLTAFSVEPRRVP